MGEDELRQRYEQLRVEHARLRQVLDLAPSYFYAVTEDGELQFANRRLAEFWDRPVEEVIGRRFAELHPDPEQAAFLMEQMLDNFRRGNTYTPETKVRDVHGNELVVEFHEIPYVDEGTGKRCLLGVANDLSERKRLEAERVQRQRMQRDLEIAREIQRRLMPETPPAVEGFEVAGWSEAADETGGDFYDWVELEDGRVFVSIADVTGHGVGPALVASICRAYARAILRGDSSLQHIFERLNRLLHDDTLPDRFITYAAGILEPRAGVVRLLSAGHGPILYYCARRNEVEHWNAMNVPLAILNDVAFEEPLILEFGSGDVLLFVSDGFHEWGNADGELFGVERLSAAVRRYADSSAAEIIERLRQDVYSFTDGTAQTDDMTAVVVRCVSG